MAKVKPKKAVANSQNAKKAVGGFDARNKIIAKNRKTLTDARDRLTKLAKTSDARQKLDKLRKLNQPTVKKTSGGGITITKTKGSISLSTKKKAGSATPVPNVKSKNRVTKSVGRGGTLSLTTKKDVTVLKKPISKRPLMPKSHPNNGRRNERPITKTVMSDAAKLDEELLRTHVDPIVLKRTVRQDVRERSPPQSHHYGRSRSPPSFFDRSSRRQGSPLPLRPRRYGDEVENFGSRRPPLRHDYDDPRLEMERSDEHYRRRLRDEMEMSQQRRRDEASLVMASNDSYVSPLQGVKVVVSNLQTTVSQEDISELFGDIGALKRVRLIGPGTAEVVFVNMRHAVKAVEIYHNRQLDGKSMKCNILGSGTNTPSSLTGIKLPQNVSSGRGSDTLMGTPDISSIHKALFSERRLPAQGIMPMSHGAGSNLPGSRPAFTITMPPQDRNRRY